MTIAAPLGEQARDRRTGGGGVTPARPTPPVRPAVPARRLLLPLLAAAVVGGHFAAMRGLEAGSQTATDISVLTLIATAFLAAASCAATARRATGRTRTGWALLGAGMLSWGLGETVWAYHVSLRHTVAPFPSIGDVGYLALVPLALGGMMALLSLRRGAATRALLDGLVIAGSLLFLSWAFVLEPIYAAGNLTPAAKAVSLAYPLGDVALGAMALILVNHAGPGRRAAAALIAGAAVTLSVADLGFAYLNQQGTYKCGSPVDTGWVAGFVLIALAARYTRTDQVPASQEDAPLWIALPYVPLGAALVSSCALYAARGGLDAFLFLVCITVVLLVVGRQLLALRDNLVLTRRLEAAVADLQCREEQLRHLAFHDPLTGLANRALFQDRTEHAVTSHPDQPQAVAVLYIDLDGFKAVNDKLGHAVGDSLLVAVGRRLRGCLRPGDTVARLGGDEFAILLDGVNRADKANPLAERIVRVLGEPFEIHGHRVMIGASVGVAQCEAGADEAGALLRRADVAMYAAKVQGKGRWASLPTGFGDPTAIAAA